MADDAAQIWAIRNKAGYSVAEKDTPGQAWPGAGRKGKRPGRKLTR